MLSLVIPVYNEESIISKCLTTVLHHLRKNEIEYEVIVVNDGSKDNTVSIVNGFIQSERRIRLLDYPENRGKGFAVCRGMLTAKGDIAMFIDADLSTPITELDRFMSSLTEGYDVVIGSRKMPESRIIIHQPFYREKMGILYSRLSALILGVDIVDFTCGFKAFSGEAARNIFARQTIERWSFDSEILYIAHALGYRIKEIPVEWHNVSDSQVRLQYDILGSFWGLVKTKWRAWRGAYG